MTRTMPCLCQSPCTKTHTWHGRIVPSSSSRFARASPPCRKLWPRAFPPTPRRPLMAGGRTSKSWEARRQKSRKCASISSAQNIFRCCAFLWPKGGCGTTRKTCVAPLSIVRDIRAQIVQIDPEQQVMRVRDLDAWITGQEEYAQQRLMATLFGVFSALALALAAVGLYSVVSYGVATRTNEFGIRMALGAQAADVFRIVLSSTAVNVGAGVIAGIVLSIAFNKLSTKWVTESSRDPLLLGGVTVLLVAAATLACLVPARRAAATDPMQALRYD